MEIEPQAVQPDTAPEEQAQAPAQPRVTQVTPSPVEAEQPGVNAPPPPPPEAAASAEPVAPSAEPPVAEPAEVVEEADEDAAPDPLMDALEDDSTGDSPDPRLDDSDTTDAAPAESEPESDVTDELFADEEEEEQPILLSMGVVDMDKRMGGGIPLESLTLVEGDPESGKSVVIQQLTYGALKEGLRVSIFLSEQTVREFINQMEDLGMEVIDHYLVGRLSLYAANLRVDQQRAERLMEKLIGFMETSEDSDVFIVDSITPLLFQFDARYVLSFLATCRDIAATGRTILVTLHSYAINESLRLRAGSIVDAHLRLSIEELGAQVVRTMEVAKIRGAVKTIGNTVSFNVEQGLGLKSIPISKTKG